MKLDSPAVAEVGTAPSASAQWVIFVCSGRRLAIRLERVGEIVTPRPFTRLPGAGPAAAGLIGVRSRIITAYDVGVLLGARPARDRPDHRILLVDAGTGALGLVVDEVVAIGALEVERAEPDEVIMGTADWEGVPVAALDLDRLLERALHP